MKIWRCQSWRASLIIIQLLLLIMTTSATIYDKIQAIIGTDAGDRGMKPLIVPGDLALAGTTLAELPAGSKVIVLSGFPCCVTQNPPTETDGPPGTFSIARTAAALGHEVTVMVDDCNKGTNDHLLFANLLFGQLNLVSRISHFFIVFFSLNRSVDRRLCRCLERTCRTRKLWNNHPGNLSCNVFGTR